MEMSRIKVQALRVNRRYPSKGSATDGVIPRQVVG